MRVNCENCNSNFNLDEGLVKRTGSKVRCSKCKHIFVIYPPAPVEDAPTTEAPLGDVEQEADKSAPFSESEPPVQEDADSTMLQEAPSEEPEGDSLDLSDIEKMLEDEDAPEVFAEEPEESLAPEDTAIGENDSLDLSDIEKMLDDDDDSDELIDEKSDEDEDLIFDLEEEIEMGAGEDQISPSTELDLGDLEKLFESDEEPESAMDEDFEPEATEAASMSFGLEAEEEDQPPAPKDEMSLEAEGETLGEETEVGGESFGFDIESAEEGEDVQMVSDGEDTSALDFEIKDEDVEPEEALDFEATIAIDSEGLVPETEDLDLSMEDVSEVSEIDEDAIEMDVPQSDEMGIAPDSDELELAGDELEIELEGEDLELEDDGLKIELEDDEDEGEDVGEISDALEETTAEGELMDFGEEEDMEYPDESVPEIPDEEETYDEEVPYLEEDQETEEDIEEIAVEAASGGGLKKFFIFLTVVLAIVVLFAALLFVHYKGIFTVPYLDRIEIPFLSKQKASQQADIGNLKITYNVENYRFLQTDKAGKVFIITGKVKNEYSDPRSFIQMSGSLYTRGKTKADSATAFCGNVISDLELSQMTAAAIRTRLGNRNGENNSNVNIQSGEERPFMIVFFDLPDSLDEFTVAVEGSSAGSK